MTKPTLFTFSLLLAFFVFTERAAAQTDDRARAAAEIESLRSRIRELEATLLAPSDDPARGWSACSRARSGTAFFRRAAAARTTPSRG
jgi:hypothetical protein